MKKYLLLFASLISLSSYAQTDNLKSLQIKNEQKIQISAFNNNDQTSKDNFNTQNCEFTFDETGFHSKQTPSNNYVVYEIPEMKSSELKASLMAIISSLYNSPKDVITDLGENIIQLETYSPKAFYASKGGKPKQHSVTYSIIIRIKDGKIRYDAPHIKKYAW